MLAVINKVDVESTFNARSPKPFIDRVEITEIIDDTNPSTNSSIIATIDSHINDISLSEDQLAILDNPYLLENLYIHFLLVKSAHFEDFNTDDFYKLSRAWQMSNLNSERYSKATFKLSELFNFDIAEDREELSKSLRFEDADADIFVLPLQTVELQLPIVYSSEGAIFDDDVYLITYISPNEERLNSYESLSLREKNYLNSFFSGVNYVEILKSQDINDQKIAYFDEAAGAYWQTDVISDSNGRIYGAQTFSSREILTKYYEFILNKEREVSPSERIRMRDLFVSLKTSFFATIPDSNCLVNLKSKVDALVQDFANKFEELSIINSAIGFINGVDQQLTLLPLLQSAVIGDIRIQRQSLNFLEGIEVGLTDSEMVALQSGIRDPHIFSDFNYTSDDDGSVELYLLVNKTNLMLSKSNLALRFPNLKTYISDIDSFFTLSRGKIFRGHRLVEPGDALDAVMSAGGMDTEIADFKFETDETSDKNKNIQFFGKFVGQREILELQQQDESVTQGTTTVTEGVSDSEETETESEDIATTTTRTISEAVVSTIDVSTNGFATALAHFDSNGDEIILFSLNDQSVNASVGDPVESIVSVPSITSLSFERENSLHGPGTTYDQQRTEEAIDEFSELQSDVSLFLAYNLLYTTYDNISLPLLSLFNDLEKAIEELENYESEASEKCSFNDIAFKFNDFFIDQQYRNYAIISEAPWNKLSSALALHATIFNRNVILQNEVLYNAKQIKRKLDPKSASLYTIRLVLNSAQTMRDSIRTKLVNLGAIRFNSGLGRFVNSVVFETKNYPEVTTSDKYYSAKLSQYDGITQLDPVSSSDVTTVFSPPSLDTLLGQFVLKLKPAINKAYRDCNGGDSTYGSNPGGALSRLAWWVITNRRKLKRALPNNQQDRFDGVAKMKLNIITPYRNTKVITDEFGWKNNTIKVKGRFEAVDSGIEMEQGATDQYTINFADFNRQEFSFGGNTETADSGGADAEVFRSVQKMTYVMATAENIFGNLSLPTGRVNITTYGGDSTSGEAVTSEEPEFKSYYLSEFSEHRLFDSRVGNGNATMFRNNGFGSNKHHIAFYSGNSKISHKSAHNEFNGSNMRDYLNAEIFRTVNRGGSGVNDRDSLNANNKTQTHTYAVGNRFAHDFYEAYLVAFAEVFSEVDFGDGFKDTTQLSIDGNIENHLFVNLYRSGFYPWPGFPELPDSLDMTLDEYIGE